MKYDRGKIVKKYRKLRGWSQTQLGNEVGASTSAISKLESGKSTPSEEIMNNIQQVLNIREITYAEYHPLLQKLNAWQKSISMGNHKIADSYHHEFKDLSIRSLHDQTGLYSLCHFRYALMKFNLDYAGAFLEDVKKHADVIPASYSYHYYKSLGCYYLLRSQMADAWTYLKVAAKLDKEQFNHDGEIHLYYALAYYFRENFADSHQHAIKALILFQDKMNQPNILYSRFLVIKNQIRKEATTTIIEQLHTILDNYPSTHKYYIYYLISSAYMQQDDYEQALKYIRKALHHETNPFFRERYLYLYAYIYALMGDVEMTITMINGGLKMAISEKYQYRFYILKEIVQRTYGSESFRKRVSEEIIPFYQSNGDVVEAKYCHAILGDVYYRLRSYKQACKHYYVFPGNRFISHLLQKYPVK
ncbi:helix-turn-helix domain-containing protein [Gracilibacillus caseinilyticus]|uniref:Helix-turn-helix domain-containing protein n=1 Tax=Gracilibacillus caseinilyticus TaxID=2932256 RepID=A0ABY4F2J7_9BACI|nr:helix-turn-helix transcriptional regulator [Gracilibacillus caseinilyticus]UOQ50298.1 helix-turn-helix domain-containing protein [Gracilibacillus caseinilyticus]